MFENTKHDSDLPVVNYLGICIIFGLNWAIGSLGHFTRSIHSCKLKLRQLQISVHFASVSLPTESVDCVLTFYSAKDSPEKVWCAMVSGKYFYESFDHFYTFYSKGVSRSPYLFHFLYFLFTALCQQPFSHFLVSSHENYRPALKRKNTLVHNTLARTHWLGKL